MDDHQRLYDIIAILTKKLGGKAEITDEELRTPPEGTVTSDRIGGKIVIEVKS